MTSQLCTFCLDDLFFGVEVEKVSVAIDASAGRPAIASRAASTPIDVESSSYEATALVPLPPPDPSAAPMVDRWSRQYGTYAP